jgi:hypothetical protein
LKEIKRRLFDFLQKSTTNGKVLGGHGQDMTPDGGKSLPARESDGIRALARI